MRVRTWAVVALAVTVAVAGGWSYLWAQNGVEAEPDACLSADTSVYVRLNGTETFSDSFKKTAAHKAIYYSGLAQMVVPLVERAMNMALQQSNTPPNAQPVLATMHKVALHVLKHGATIGVVPRLLGTEATIVLHDAGKNGLADEIQSRVQDFLEIKKVDGHDLYTLTFAAQRGQNVQVGWWKHGPHLAVTIGFGDPMAAFKRANGEGSNLTNSPKYGSYKAKAEFDPASQVWVDFETLMLQVPIPQVQTFLDQSGLRGLKGIKVQVGFEGDAVRTDIDALTGKRDGFLNLFDGPPLSLEKLPALPGDTQAVMASSLDAAGAYDVVIGTARKLIETFHPEQADRIDAHLAKINHFLGYNLRDDLLAALGDSMLIYQSSLDGPLGFGGISLAVAVRDKQRLAATLDKQVALLTAQDSKAFVERKAVEGMDLWIGGYREGGFPLAPTIGLNDDWMVVGIFSPAQVLRFFRLQKEDTGRWKAPARLEKLMAHSGQEGHGFIVTDPGPLARALASTIPMIAAMARNASPELELDLTKLPDIEKMVSGIFAGVAVYSVDDQGLHLVSHSAVPMSGLGGLTAGIGVAALLPAVQSARDAARLTQDRNNQKQIGLAIHNYHDVFKALPRGTDRRASNLKVEQRLSWMASVLPFVEQTAAYDKLDFSQPWDSEVNAAVTGSKIPSFQNPLSKDSPANSTHYVGIAGVGKDAPTLKVDHPRAGVFGYDRETSFRDIRDGTSNTIAVMGVNKQLGPWGQGGPSSVRGLTAKPYIHGPDGFGTDHRGVNALLADGSVRTISKDVDPAVLEALVTKSGGEVVNLK